MNDAWRRRPRLLASLVFAFAGTLLPSAWFLRPIVQGGGDPISLILYIGLPCAAGAMAGAMFGKPLVVPSGAGGDVAAAFRGAWIATVALLLFAPLYAVTLEWAEPQWSGLVGLILLVLFFSALAVWWMAAALGAFTGWALYRWARYALR